MTHRIGNWNVPAILAGCLLALIAGCDDGNDKSVGPDDGNGDSATTRSADDANTPAPAQGPVIRVDGNDAMWQVGTIATNSSHKATFVLVNGDSEPLRVVKVLSDCECFQPLSRPEVIPPQASKPLVAEFQAPNVPLRYNSQLTVLTDREDRRMIFLKLSADIKKP